ncbi:50S ribosomal protein L19e [Candidatus Woesearchaeota archaeon]|nr:50S ribosomal protein L19e [Candidatus Woesearchaeota archaeon]
MKQKKKLAAKILKTSYKKIKFNTDALDDIKKAITRSDLRGLIAVGKITRSNKNSQSHVRARKMAAQKRKGRRKNKGSKKGSKHATVSRKETWMSRIRTQRAFLHELRDKSLLSRENYKGLYLKCKGGYFRNKRHIKMYITEHHLVEKQNADKNEKEK